MGEALYRKYRPRSLAEVIGQNHITSTLNNAIKAQKIRHGYLFSGPRGVGKTSVARILAHLVNEFDYGRPSTQIDIIEIDAASNRRIDEIRELRDKVHIAPSTGKYKIYIIDEVHMLTREAFNALLKILEEPPTHAIFILATTEANKLPATIISRTQHFTFKPVPAEDIASHLKDIAKKENITIDDTAALHVAEYGQGSFRDSISLLDQLSNYNAITIDEVLQVIGGLDHARISNLHELLRSGNLSDVIQFLHNLYNEGIEPKHISNAFIELLRQNMIATPTSNPHEDLQLMKQLLDVEGSVNPGRYLEIILCEYNLAHGNQGTNDKTGQPSEDKPAKLPSQQKKQQKDTPSVSEKEKTSNNATTTKPKVQNMKDASAVELWESCLNSLKNKHNTLYGLARMATPQLNNDELYLEVPYAFHKKRLEEKKSQAAILQFINGAIGRDIELVIVVKEKSVDPVVDTPQDKSSDIYSEVSKIFGGGEVVET